MQTFPEHLLLAAVSSALSLPALLLFLPPLPAKRGWSRALQGRAGCLNVAGLCTFALPVAECESRLRENECG